MILPTQHHTHSCIPHKTDLQKEKKRNNESATK